MIADALWLKSKGSYVSFQTWRILVARILVAGSVRFLKFLVLGADLR